jgi:hypothetical protein
MVERRWEFLLSKKRVLVFKIVFLRFFRLIYYFCRRIEFFWLSVGSVQLIRL